MKSLNILIIAGVAAILGLGFFMLKHPPQPPVVTVVEEPRTDAPMEQFTRFFAKKQYDVDDGKQKRTITYYMFDPEKPYPAGLKFPLVVVLHGAPGKAYAAEYLISKQMQLDFPSFILAPQSPFGKKWAMPEKFSGQEFGNGKPANYVYHPELDSLPDTIELIRRLELEYPIDASRVYIVGCSDGGTGVYGAVMRYPNIFAGATAISGAWSFLDAAKMKQVPLWIIHGSLDETFPVTVARGMSQGIKQQGGPVFYSEFPSMGHECSASSLYGKALWQWLFGQRKSR